MSLDPYIKRIILSDWEAAPYGAKMHVLQEWAGITGYSVRNLSRELGNKDRRTKGKRRIENIEDYVNIVFQIKKKPPEHIGEITTEQAIRIAISNGLIPDEMKNVSISTFDRIGREENLNKKVRRVQRFQAEYPNQLHHVDASSSKCFYVHRKTPDGDYVLKLHRGSQYYKNKPAPIRLRPWVYGLVDDYSGYYVARYTVAYGENAKDNLLFLAWAWEKNEDKPFFGLPEKLKGDLGPMMRGKSANNFLERLNVEKDPSEPENKEAHGKIERPWRTVWQRFEAPFFVQPDWKKFEITLSELNRQFLNFQQEYNNRAHRYEKEITRLQAWKRINQRGGAVAMPENALSTITKTIERTVGADGCFCIDNVPYEVKGLHNAKVYVEVGVFEDKIAVKDKNTGEKYEVENFKPNPVGTFTAHKETAHQGAVKAAKTLEVTNTLYETPQEQGNITHFPTHVKKIREVENPLAVDAYSSVDEAIKGFISICGVRLNKENREAIKNLIIEHGLSRRFVTDLALQVESERDRLVKCHKIRAEKRCLDIKKKIQGLQKKKSDLINLPIEKQEFLKELKKQVESNKAEVLKELTGYLSDYHEKNIFPFRLSDAIFNPVDIDKILYLTLTDKDLEDMVSALPNKGEPTKKTLAKIKKIDDEIDGLRNTLEEEIKSIESSLPSPKTEEIKPKGPALSSAKQTSDDEDDETEETYKRYEGTTKYIGGVLQGEETTFK